MKIKWLNVLLLLCLTGNLKASKPQIVATTSMIADIAQNVAGELLEVQTIVPIGGDPHRYAPVPQDAQKVAAAHLILVNGLKLEGWLSEFIENSGTKARIVTVSDGVEPIQSLVYKNAPDPHAWMTAENGVRYAENILKAFIALDPANQASYTQNWEAYKAKLEALEAEIYTLMQQIPPKRRVLITSHDAFQYFGRKYGLRLEAILGISTEADAQTSDIVRVQKVIQTTGVPAVFIESTVNPKLLQQVARDNRVQIGGKLYADSLGEPTSDGSTYIGMLRHNAQTIAQGLTQTTTPTAQTPPQNTTWLTVVIGGLLVGGLVFMFRKMNR